MSDRGEKRSLLGRWFGRAGETAEPDQNDRSGQQPDAAGSAEAGAMIEARDIDAPEPAKKASWFQRLKAGLSKTSSKLADGITSVFSKRKLDAATLEEFEDLLLQADLGVETSMRITEAVARGRYDKTLDPEEVRGGRSLSSRTPRYEATVAVRWPAKFPALSPDIRIPVRLSHAEHERVWRTDPDTLGEIARGFTSSPRLVSYRQAGTGHNMSVGFAATAYHRSVLAFVEECTLAAERPSA